MDRIFEKERIQLNDSILIVDLKDFFITFYVPYCHYIKMYNLSIRVVGDVVGNVVQSIEYEKIKGEEMENNILFSNDKPTYNLILLWDIQHINKYIHQSSHFIFFLTLNDKLFSTTIILLDKILKRVSIHVLKEKTYFFQETIKEYMFIYQSL